MKKKLLFSAVVLIILIGLGLALFLSSRDASSQEPTAPIPYTRPEETQSLHTPGQSTHDQNSPDQTTMPQDTAPPETLPESTAPEHTATSRELVPDGTIISEDGDLAIIYNANCNYDIYADSHAGNIFKITIISTDAIATSTISADALGLQSETTSISDFTEYLQYEWENQHYVGQTLAGVDWVHARSLHRAMTDAKENYFADTTNTANQQHYTKAKHDYDDYMNPFLTEGLAIQMKPATADFYVYYVYLEFNELATETVVEEIELKIGADSYRLPVGQLRFHPSLTKTCGVPFWFSNTPGNFSTNVHDTQVFPWDDGRFSTSFQFSVPENMILERLEVMAGDGTVIDEIWIDHVDAASWAQWREQADKSYGEDVLVGPNEEFLSGFRFFWDGKMSVYLNAGDQVYVNLRLHSPELAQFAHYQSAVRYILHYTTAEGTFAMIMEHDLQQEQCSYALYYTYLEDVDFRSCFPYLEEA